VAGGEFKAKLSMDRFTCYHAFPRFTMNQTASVTEDYSTCLAYHR
jgi:hypothetical protein